MQITERAKFSSKAVVIGGGLLGLEAAKAVGVDGPALERWKQKHQLPIQFLGHVKSLLSDVSLIIMSICI